jgi:hypothetical protein
METILALIENLNNENEIERRIAISELGEIGIDAIAPLVQVLLDHRPMVRGGAALALGKIGPAACSAIPTLVNMMGDEVAHVRNCATDALSSMGEVSVASLEETLSGSDYLVQGGAAMALGRLGNAARHVTPAIVRLLSHEDPFVFKQASIALGKVMANDIGRLVKVFEHVLEKGPSQELEGLIIALRDTQSKADEVGIALFQAYQMTSGPIQKEAFLALRAIYPVVERRENRKSTTTKVPGKLLAAWILKYEELLTKKKMRDSIQDEYNSRPGLRADKLADELGRVRHVLVIRLGNATEAALQILVSQGILNDRQCLIGFPHPAGGNGHRVRQFNEAKPRLMRRVAEWFEDAVQGEPSREVSAGNPS